MPSPSQPPTLETPTALTSSPATAISGQSLMDTGHCCFSPWENPQIPCCSLETWWFIPPAMPGPIRVPSDGFGGAGPITLVLMGKRQRKASHGEMALHQGKHRPFLQPVELKQKANSWVFPALTQNHHHTARG